MKFFLTFAFLATSTTVITAAPVRRDVDPSLVPEFGLQAGLNPTGTGDCDGITNAAGQVVKIPCSCPPDRDAFIQSINENVNAGKVVNNPTIPVSFPTDNSQASQLARLQTAIVTLQNLNGPGVGSKAIQDGTGAATSSPAPATPAGSTGSVSSSAPASPASSPAPAGGVDPALVPDFGHQAGLNPTGTGDCDGITNAAGQVVKVPCSCPPDRDTFIQSLSANVAAGHAVNNPSVSVSFPTDDSNASKAARIQASLITLQNLNGPGEGCPAASTTFSAQLQAVQS
ncbi:hypothetical protein BDQ17DRAFT_1325024 [Cyathus striatus]|nr:hypothetical protein BDQ17DRAFT_1325024 [Cyathus striatus]